MTNHSNVRMNLMDLLKAFPSLSENYNDLCSHYWAIYDGATNLSEISKATPAETITRNFRKLVENGLVTLPDSVLEARAEKQREFHSEFKSLV